jgi:hypothetical protein
VSATTPYEVEETGDLVPPEEYEQVWQAHTDGEFVHKDVAATMRTMTADPHVVHVSTALGARGRDAVEIPVVAVVGIRDGLIDSEHIYWDQASVLAQVGLLDPNSLPVLGAAQTRCLTGEMSLYALLG